MDHKTYQEKLLAFRDAELSDEERRKIAAHAEQCAECRAVLDAWGRLGTVLSRTAMPAASKSFVDGVMGRLARMEEPEPEPARPAWFPNWLFPALGYAFAFFLMFAAITHPNARPLVNTETVLLTYTSQGSEWTFSKEPADIIKIVGMKEGT